MLRSGINRVVAAVVGLLFVLFALIGFVVDSANEIFNDTNAWVYLLLAFVLLLGAFGGHLAANIFNAIVGFFLLSATIVVVASTGWDTLGSDGWFHFIIGLILVLVASFGVKYWDERKA